MERITFWSDAAERIFGYTRPQAMGRPCHGLIAAPKHRVAYRHIIDWLVRKPGAFENYRYREGLFPSSRFRMAYDALKQTAGAGASKAYLRILHLAARETESGVDQAIGWLVDAGQPITPEAVETVVRRGQSIPPPTDVTVDPVDLIDYDDLLPGDTGREGLVAREVA